MNFWDFMNRLTELRRAAEGKGLTLRGCNVNCSGSWEFTLRRGHTLIASARTKDGSNANDQIEALNQVGRKIF